MHVPVRALKQGELHGKTNGDTSTEMRMRVEQTREIQIDRQGKANNLLTAPELEKYCALTYDNKVLLENAITKMGLSTRAYHRVLKVARTLADMEAISQPNTEHISEALSYRTLDRQ